MTSFLVRSYMTDEGVRYRVVQKLPNGKQKTVASGLPSEKEAQKLKRAAKIESQKVRAGVVVVTPTVKEVVDDYVETLEGEWKTNSERNARVHLLPALGAKEVGELRRADVVDLVEALRKTVSAQMTKHVVGTLRAAINRAIEREEFAGPNVALRIDVKLDDVRTKQVLYPEEIPFVVPHLRADLADYMALTMACGARPGELLNAERERASLAERMIEIRDTKTKKDRVVVVPAYAMEWFARAIDDAGESRWLFPLARDAHAVKARKLTRHLHHAMKLAAKAGCHSLAESWDYTCNGGHTETRATRAVGGVRCATCNRRCLELPRVRDVKFRELRHTGGTLLIEAGLSIDDVAAQMGNDPRVLRKHYDASRPTRRRKLMDQVTLPTSEPTKAKEGA